MYGLLTEILLSTDAQTLPNPWYSECQVKQGACFSQDHTIHVSLLYNIDYYIQFTVNMKL